MDSVEVVAGPRVPHPAHVIEAAAHRPARPNYRAQPMLAALAFATLILALMLLQIRSAPLAADAPATTFSASRAMRHVAAIARAPHPVGTAAHTEVRAMLVGELQALGMAPQVQSSFGIGTRNYTAGIAHNVVARLPGARPGKALLLAAHYDSMPMSRGAADDGASVAAILEALRALRAGPALQNDIIVLFSDAEEANSIGAENFVASHPWAREVGLALNFEYRGSGGSMLLFETSGGNGRLINGLAALDRLAGTSLMPEAYRFLGHPTDMGAFKRAGLPGLNFAGIERAHQYHSELDRAERLDQSALQEQGQLILDLAHHFGNAELGGQAEDDKIYFDIFERALVSYPMYWALPLTLLLVAATTAVVAQGMRKRTLRLSRVLLGVPAFLIVLAALTAAAHLAWLISGLPAPERALARFIEGGHWFLAGSVALVIGGYSLLLRRLERWFSALELALGSALGWAAILVAATVWAPGATFLLAWPLAFFLVSVSILQSSRADRFHPVLLIAVQFAGLLPALLLFTPFVRTLHLALPPQLLALSVMPVVLVLGLGSAAFMGWPRWVGGVVLAIGAGAIFMGVEAARFSTDNPRPVHLNYVQHEGEPGPVWMSLDAELHPWAAKVFGRAPIRRQLPDLYTLPDRMWVGPAPDHALALPSVEVLGVTPQGEGRKIHVRARSLRNAQHLSVELSGDVVTEATANGRALSRPRSSTWRIDTYGMDDKPVDVVLTTQRALPVSIHVTDTTYGLRGLSGIPRPADAMSRPGGWSDRMMAVKVAVVE